MGYLCDFCGDQRSMVYCRSDAACLCLSCDRNVHSANPLSERHSRTLLCERCNSQPALVRYAEEKVSLCQNCDWTGHGTSIPASSHKRQTINCYSGCPSASELSSIWSFVLDSPSVSESTFEQELGLMSITKNSISTSGPPENESDSIKVDDVQSMDKSNNLVRSSSRAQVSSAPQSLNQIASSTNATLPKLFCPGIRSHEFCEDDDLYKDFDMDEVDLNLENYEELFGVALSHSEKLFENGGIDSLFGTKELCGANSSCHGAVTPEGSSAGRVNSIRPVCSTAASVDSMISTRTEPIPCVTARQGHSSLSFSGLTGESNAGDHQDCGVSPMGESLQCPPGAKSSYQSASRNDAVLRYKEKKKTRKFEKRVRYASRKARADIRKRVKGRFVKADEIYDYDPLSQTRSY